MYDSISPDLKLKGTISNPLDPAEVLGFEGRDTKLGRPAVVLKGPAIRSYDGGEIVAVPEEYGKKITDSGWSVFLLESDRVQAMMGADFAEEAGIHTFEGRGQTASMYFVLRDDDGWYSWPQSSVSVSN
jgi:hypothetical protein